MSAKLMFWEFNLDLWSKYMARVQTGENLLGEMDWDDTNL